MPLGSAGISSPLDHLIRVRGLTPVTVATTADRLVAAKTAHMVADNSAVLTDDNARSVTLDLDRPTHRTRGNRILVVDPADVPLQRLVLPVNDHGNGRDPRLPAPGRGRGDLRGDRARGGHPSVRRAGGHEHAAQCRGRAEALARSPHRDDDRRGAAARRRHRGHGGPRVSHHPCLRADRVLWPRCRLRLAQSRPPHQPRPKPRRPPAATPIVHISTGLPGVAGVVDRKLNHRSW